MLSILNHIFILSQTWPPAAESLIFTNLNISYFILIENDFRLNILFEFKFLSLQFLS